MERWKGWRPEITSADHPEVVTHAFIDYLFRRVESNEPISEDLLKKIQDAIGALQDGFHDEDGSAQLYMTPSELEMVLTDFRDTLEAGDPRLLQIDKLLESTVELRRSAP